MKIKYLIQENINNQWKNREDLGFFYPKIEAEEKIFLSLKNKKEFWFKFKVIQVEVSPS
jgi:hypothetical protein